MTIQLSDAVARIHTARGDERAKCIAIVERMRETNSPYKIRLKVYDEVLTALREAKS